MEDKIVIENGNVCTVKMIHRVGGNILPAITSSLKKYGAEYVAYRGEDDPLGGDKKPIKCEPELRQAYDRKRYILYPVLVKDKVMAASDEEQNNAYIVFDKRMLRSLKKTYRFMSVADINVVAHQNFPKAVEVVNNAVKYGYFECEVTVNNGDNVGKRQIIGNIVTSTAEDLASTVIDRLEYMESELDKLVKVAADRLWTQEFYTKIARRYEDKRD